jgi:hypothetical protein
MPGRDDMPLFRSGDLLSDEQLRTEAEVAVAPQEGERRPDLDAARLWQSRDDGLLVRGVKPHSAAKSPRQPGVGHGDLGDERQVVCSKTRA